MIETLTCEEATQILRHMGMRITPDTVRAGLEQGVYPFGVCIRGKKAPVYQIFRRLFDAWVEDRVS